MVQLRHHNYRCLSAFGLISLGSRIWPAGRVAMDAVEVLCIHYLIHYADVEE
jgi:hypothetical protein